MAGFYITGFNDVFDMVEDMIVTEEDERRALNKALKVLDKELEPNIPERTGKLKKSRRRSIKRQEFNLVGTLTLNRFYDIFAEYGTSKSKKHIGFFSKSVNNAESEIIKVIAREIFK